VKRCVVVNIGSSLYYDVQVQKDETQDGKIVWVSDGTKLMVHESKLGDELARLLRAGA